MANWRAFNATNKLETCLWCGNKLRWPRVATERLDTARIAAGEKPKTRRAYQNAGNYGDGHFCGLRCGYQFAVTLANGGRRLKPREPREGAS